jgi:hypothetical protein
MKLWPTLFFSILCGTTFAQQKEVTGIVFDKDSKARVAKVNVQNISSGKGVYNNFKGEFTIGANPGDVLVFSKPDHHSDTLTVKTIHRWRFTCGLLAIQLQQVTIRDSFLTPQRRLANTQREFSKIYGSSYNPDLLNVGSGGVGFSIDALYNAFSKSGRNAEKLRGLIDAEYRQSIIDYRFNKAFVQGITHLEEPKLTDFMHKYRPGYYLVTTAGDYEFITYIKANLKRYLRRPRAMNLPPLPQVIWEPDTK